MLAATSATEIGWSKCFLLPSGSVISGIEMILSNAWTNSKRTHWLHRAVSDQYCGA
jgi:hypothetical protein